MDITVTIPAEEFAGEFYKAIDKAVENLIAKDWQPVTHADWIFQGQRDSEGRNIYCCSECDFEVKVFPYNVASWREHEKYCPGCGAMMKGVK